MFAFAARLPILNRDRNVFAYELVFRDGAKGSHYPEHDEDVNAEISQKYHSLKIEDISGEKAAFIKFSAKSLLTKFPAFLDPERVIIEIQEMPSKENELYGVCQQIKQSGFKIALRTSELKNISTEAKALIDIIKVDIKTTHFHIAKIEISELLRANIQFVAEQVNSYEDFELCQSIGFDYFQGLFFAQPTRTSIASQLIASDVVLVELIEQCTTDFFSFEKVNSIIERDASLSYILLRFINNPTINKRYKINSLRHALNYMGEVEIKKFIAVLSLANINQNKPLELIHMSLVRAKFFDLLAQKRGINNNPPIGYLVGLFSMLDIILEQDMKKIVQQLPLTESVSNGLLKRSDEFNLYFELVKGFESALWFKVAKVAKSLQLEQKQLHGLYNQAILWGSGVNKTVSTYFPKKKALNS